MRTTLELPDELFRRVKAKAALGGVSLKELVTGYIVSGLQDSSPPGRTTRSRLPVIKRRGGEVVSDVTPARQAKFDEEEDIAKLRRSFGR